MKCVLGKSSRIKFNTIVHKSKGTLEYIHYDLWGSVQTTSLGGGTYLMSFIDDFSRMVQVYVLKNKDKAFDKFKVWKTLIETKIEKEIKRLWTNNGLNFVIRDLMIIVLKVELQDTRELDILHTKWACREDKLNLNRQSKVNRSPSTGINLKTPMGFWSRKLVDYSDMKIFGCPAYAHIK